MREILAAQDAQGRWVTANGGYMPGKGERVDMGTFGRNMKVLSDYLKMAKQ